MVITKHAHPWYSTLTAILGNWKQQHKRDIGFVSLLVLEEQQISWNNGYTEVVCRVGEHQHRWHIDVQNFTHTLSVKLKQREMGMGHLWLKWMGYFMA